MWDRLAAVRLRRLWRQFPAVLILGARQVGKTTLARQTFPRLPYVDLEEPRSRERFQDDPAFQLERYATTPVILDEAQAVPELFAALRGAIDRQAQKPGRFLLLGSAQPSLIRGVSESLAGRVGVLDLDPLTTAEARSGTPRRAWPALWLRGGFPAALRGDFRDWWEGYLRTYVERDLPQLGVGADPLLLRRLLTMLAHAQGGLLNASALGQSLGVSYHTVQRYLDVLEQTFLVRRLAPYHRNVRKRLVKAPKVYLRDTGLLHHLLNLPSADDVASHLRGPADPRRPVSTASDLVTWPEDIGLLAALTGQRAAAARSSGSLTNAIASLLASYAPQNGYYAGRFPDVAARTPQVRLLALSLTDTFARTAVETF